MDGLWKGWVKGENGWVMVKKEGLREGYSGEESLVGEKGVVLCFGIHIII